MAEDVHLWENLKKYLSYLLPYKWAVVGILFVIFLFELSQVLERYLFKLVLDNAQFFIEETITRNELISALSVIGAIFVGVILMRSCAVWFRAVLMSVIEAGCITDVKRKFFNHVIHLSHKFHTTHKTGSLISRVSRGGKAFESLSDRILFDITPLSFQLTTAIIALLYIDAFSVVIILIMCVLFVINTLIFQQLMIIPEHKVNLADDAEKALISDVFTNIDSIKFFGKEVSLIQKFREYTGITKRREIASWKFFRYMDAGHKFILGTGLFFLIFFSLRKFLDGDVTIGDLSFIYATALGLLRPLNRFSQGIRRSYAALTDLEQLFSYEKITNEIEDKENAPAMQVHKGTISFNDITFGYNRELFKDFSLEVEENTKVALVGHSGSGKSTLMKLLYRFYDIEKGSIEIDGINIKDVQQESLRGELSIVPQECILFDDTIYNNVAFSNPHAKRQDVFQAMKFAQLDRLVATLPKKEHTIVGERGVKLSGGEKQRVSIARAILANKKILVLDEATSALDSHTEHEIQKDLAKLMKGRTSLIIAHRLSTIMSADKIVVLDNGKIVQMGSHKTLIKKKGPYKELWSLQKGGYIE